MPNAIQNRLLAADAGFATQAGAIAGQQDAATRFANLGNATSVWSECCLYSSTS